MAGRVALVAGGSGPIGGAVAVALAGAGAAVAVHTHRSDRGDEIVAGLTGGPHLAVRGDLSDRDQVDAVVGAVEAALGPVAVLVNAVHPATMRPAPVAELDARELADQLRAVEVHAALCHRVVPAMRAGGFGRVVFVSGALMARPAPGFGAYGAAKAAASVLTRHLALEEGRAGITANVVAPGRVVDPDAAAEPLTPERAELARRLAERMALADFPTPAQVADVVSWLVSPGAAAVTGQTVWVTGGEPIGT